jgi:hypothetical protein
VSLIETLNQYGHLSPDEIADKLGDPLRYFIRCKDLTRELFDRLEGRQIVFFAVRKTYGTMMNWDNGHKTPENMNPKILGEGSYSYRYMTETLASRWAFIGYEHRMNVDPYEVFRHVAD